MNRNRTFQALGLFSIAALALAGCSSADNSSTQSASTPSQSSQAGPQSGSGPSSSGRGGVSGEIAYIADGVLQVQSSDSQTAVSYTSDTTITEQVSATLADVKVGVCVVGRGSSDSAATTVSITQPTDGECTSGMMGGGPGGSSSDNGGQAPSGRPDAQMSGDMPTGNGTPPTGDGQMSGDMPAGGFGGASGGLVTAVSGNTITVESASSTGETTTAEVTVDDSTTFTATKDASSDALTVGVCVVAQGKYNESGEDYTATSLAISPKGDDGCSTGFGGGSRSGNGGQGGRPGKSSNNG